jgi:hypothetical protein
LSKVCNYCLYFRNLGSGENEKDNEEDSELEDFNTISKGYIQPFIAKKKDSISKADKNSPAKYSSDYYKKQLSMSR